MVSPVLAIIISGHIEKASYQKMSRSGVAGEGKERKRRRPGSNPILVSSAAHLAKSCCSCHERRACRFTSLLCAIVIFAQGAAAAGSDSWLYSGKKSSVKNTAWNPLKLLPEPTRVSGYGSKRFPLPSSVSVATTTTITTVTSTLSLNKQPKNQRTQRIVETKLVANHNASNVATLFLQPLSNMADDGNNNNNNPDSWSLSSTRELQVHSARRNCTLSIQSAMPKNSHCRWNGRRPALQILHCANNDSSNSNSGNNRDCSAVDLSSWIPVQGLYGVYTLPSGHVYVWIVDSEPIYEAPPVIRSNRSNHTEHPKVGPSWWSIRRVTELHLTRVLAENNVGNSSDASKQKTRLLRQEEARQLALLRQALKHHEWYYCTGANGRSSNGSGSDDNSLDFVVSDMTRNLQSSIVLFQEQQQQQQQTLPSVPSNYEPDKASSRAAAATGNVSDTKDPVHSDTSTETIARDAGTVSHGQTENALHTNNPPRGGSAVAAVKQEINNTVVVSNSSRPSIVTLVPTEAVANTTNGESQSQWRRWWGRFSVSAKEDMVKRDTLIQLNSSYNSISDNVTTSPAKAVSDVEETIVAIQENEPLRDSVLKPSSFQQPSRHDDVKGVILPSTSERLNEQKWWWEVTNVEIKKDEARARNVRPDSRFFWNEAAVEPLLELHGQRQQRMNIGNSETPPVTILLEHVIPVTSAFCGVRTSLSVTSTESNATCIADLSNRARYDQLLITRRGRFRAGTRFTKRGADATGAVANFAETEQVVFVWQRGPDDIEQSITNLQPTSYTNESRGLRSVASHVQTRGSIPLRWSSPTDIKTYRPRIHIGTDPLAQARALRQHLVDQASHYIRLSNGNDISNNNGTSSRKQHPALLFVNLIDKHSDQGRLGRALDAVLTAVLDVYSNYEDDRYNSRNKKEDFPWLNHALIQHLWFDFHAKVKSGRWDRLEELLTSVQPTLDEQGYCRVAVTDDSETAPVGSSPFRLQHLQTGVVRTNCMDCLDRTNVVQSMFARYMLFCQMTEDQLVKSSLDSDFGVAHQRAPMVLPWSAGELAHRFLWADNADAISRLYAGTPALKGDFTRTGKRTKKGALDDGMNSLQRYYLNNFLDADRQEGVDLLTGHQQFNNLDHETYYESVSQLADGDNEDDADSNKDDVGASVRRLRRKSITVEEAARQMFLGADPSVGSFDEDDDSDSDHVRIKFQRHNPKRQWSTSMDREIGSRQARRALDLRWLPGDLQSQVRSLVSSSLANHHYPSASQSNESLSSSRMNTVRDLLHDMDERSTADMPWWVVADMSDTDASSDGAPEDVVNNRALRARVHDLVSSSSSRAGLYLIGTLVAGVQTPLATAAVVIGLIALSFPLSPLGNLSARQDEETADNEDSSEPEHEVE